MKIKETESITCILLDDEGTRVEYENVKAFTAKIDYGTGPSYWIITLQDDSTATFNMADWDLFTIRTRVTDRKELNIFRN